MKKPRRVYGAGLLWTGLGHFWRRGRGWTPRWGLAPPRFPGVRLNPLTPLSEARHCSHRARVRPGGFGSFKPEKPGLLWPVAQPALAVAWSIFIAEPISADTSVMLLGTIRVVLASDATWL